MPLLLLPSSSRLFFFPLLCLFFLLFFSLGSFMSPLSPAPFYSASLSFAHSSPQPSSLRLCLGGGGGVSPAQRLCYLYHRGWSLCFFVVYSMVSLPLLCTSCCRFWLFFFSASACFSAGSPLSSSLDLRL